jgi:hypothetical protein
MALIQIMLKLYNPKPTWLSTPQEVLQLELEFEPKSPSNFFEPNLKWELMLLQKSQ